MRPAPSSVPSPAVASSVPLGDPEPAWAVVPVPPDPGRRPLPLTPDLELLRELASGRRPISEVIDPARGIDILDGDTGGADTPPPPAHKVCGAEAEKIARDRLVAIVEHDARSRADGTGGSVQCEARSCSKAPAMEFDPAVTISFVHRPTGLALVSFDGIDVLLRDPDSVTKESADHARVLARLATGRCPTH
jgi:hypothetical protein